MRRLLPAFLILSLFWRLAFAGDAVIGIYGDIHGNYASATQVLDQMKRQGVTHIIGTGDYIEWGGAAQLEKMLKMISDRTGVPRQNIYLMPGNWEHETSMSPAEANRILLKYGHLITPDQTSYGYVSIEGKRILVSHFPQHEIPREMLPEGRYLYRIPEKAFVLDTVKKGVHPDSSSAFEVFAHTHIAGHFIEPVSGKLAINAGTLHETKKSEKEPMAFAIYHTGTDTLSFFRVGDAHAIETVSLAKTTKNEFVSLDGCATLLKVVGQPSRPAPAPPKLPGASRTR